MDHTGGEYPCKYCKKQTRVHCSHSDEREWDWSTDDVCPGFVDNRDY